MVVLLLLLLQQVWYVLGTCVGRSSPGRSGCGGSGKGKGKGEKGRGGRAGRRDDLRPRRLQPARRVQVRACKSAFHCTQEHQRLHWKEGGHKRHCDKHQTEAAQTSLALT